MRFSPHCISVASLFLACFAGNAGGQTGTANSAPNLLAGRAVPGYVKARPISLGSASETAATASSAVLTFPKNAATSREVFASSNREAQQNTTATSGNNAVGLAQHAAGNIPGIVTVPTFFGAFAPQAGPFAGQVFPYIMMGNDPHLGGTTEIPTKITSVSLQLQNPPKGFSDRVPFDFEDLATDSPNFQNTNYGSGQDIQFADAIQRAEFFNNMVQDWHTTLGEPQILDRATVQIPQTVQVRLPNGKIITVQAYSVAKAADGHTAVFLLDLLFNNLFQTLAVNDIIAGNYTTDAVNMQLWPNTYLFSITDNGSPGPCCVLGFHTFFFDPTVTPQPDWIFNFASWISPGLFGGGFEDATAISHELSETFNDPLVNNLVAPWQFPNQPPKSKVCQANLETGDPVEVLPSATVPIKLEEGTEVFTYHPQTEALLQWFEMGKKSDAVDGAFSYPNTAALPHSAVPCPQ